MRQGNPLSCLLYDFSIEPMGMCLCAVISSISLYGLPPAKLIAYADNMNLFLSTDEEEILIKQTMSSTATVLSSMFNLSKTDLLILGPPNHPKSSHDAILDCFSGGSIVPPGSSLCVLGAWIGSPDFAKFHWEQILSHIRKIVHQWNAIRVSTLNRALLAKALLLSCCYCFLNCNSIPGPVLSKINSAVCHFICGRYSNVPFRFLSMPLSLGGLNCPSLHEHKLAYDAKFLGDLISGDQSILWKLWSHVDLQQASGNMSCQPGVILNPLLQHAHTTLSHLEPHLHQAFVSC